MEVYYQKIDNFQKYNGSSSLKAILLFRFNVVSIYFASLITWRFKNFCMVN